MNNEVIQPDFSRDVCEAKLPRDLLELLLIDRTTGKNILWMTDSYERLEPLVGRKLSPTDEMDIDLIAREDLRLIRPRVDKSKEEQRERIQKKAEVFTPAWVCNDMINMADAAWFDLEKSPFTTDGSREAGWKRLPGKVPFSTEPKKGWLDYVDDRRLEMCCGEAPFLVSRYEATTGDVIPVPERIGILDRKLRVVTENIGTDDPAGWLKYAIRALQATLGFDWQGDNVLIARENILFTMLEYYKFYCSDEPLTHDTLLELGNIISWNIWQMDGLKFVVPMSCHDEPVFPKKPKAVHPELFALPEASGKKTTRPQPLTKPCPGCKKKRKPLEGIFDHNGVYCMAMDWSEMEPFRFVDIIKLNEEEERRRQEVMKKK